MASDWPLLTGGSYSEVVVRTGLTVFGNAFIFPFASVYVYFSVSL
jgi:hypothetical protein